MKNFSRSVLWAFAVLRTIAAAPLQPTNNTQSNIWDFSLLRPSPQLNWTPCFDNFTCTILEVPLDYSNTAAGTVGIAFIKWTAKNASSAQDILVNPGGPGDSGIATVQQHLGEFQKYLGTSYNIIGFDPRGVNNSGPPLSCFPGKKDTAKLYDPQWRRSVDSSSKSSMLEQWAAMGAFGEWCSDVHHPSSPARYVNTAATAADMLRYVEVAAEAKGQKKEDAKLWYYGISYGTILGSTFASLWPNRVGRMILDGVVDGEDYYQGKWQNNLVDADEGVRTFFKDCFAAGKELCSFWDESPEAIEKRFEAIVKDLTDSPIIVADRSLAVQTPTVITLGKFKTYLTRIPYDPITWFPNFAAVLTQLEKRNGTYFVSVTGAGRSLDQCSLDEVEPTQVEPRFIIGCNDANGRFNLSTIDAWTEHVHLLLNQSRWLGELWATGPATCRSLEVSNHVPESQRLKSAPSAKNTSAPILFVSTTIDPVTPLGAARKALKLFGGSGLLIQNNAGHGSISAFSACSKNALERYLADSSLPEEGKVCEVDEVPFRTQQGGTDGQARGLLETLWKSHYL
ncbi:hypothetical protein CC80DRAFT_487925 [Byssothecium circinans]|uniref:Alpha/beta-hydrolase n=1 Tax=Byssothecium circinans TaxID=147558 RepID=A0A6A5UHU2_9PLEO|nr:hypothetical protein CC80DRAFT_487925 [Byssothecium circinans]